jgi:Flp pilus assembly pilin Flp
MAVASLCAVLWRQCSDNRGKPDAQEARRKMKIARELFLDETGASMAEYAMLLALIAVATIGAVQALRNQIVAVFNTSASTLGSAK